MYNLVFFPSLWRAFKIFINFKRNRERRKIKLHCVYLAGAAPSLSHLRKLQLIPLSGLPRGCQRGGSVPCPLCSSLLPTSTSRGQAGLYEVQVRTVRAR